MSADIPPNLGRPAHRALAGAGITGLADLTLLLDLDLDLEERMWWPSALSKWDTYAGVAELAKESVRV